MPDAFEYREIFDASPNAYMVVDRELRYVAANPAYLKETGSTLEQLVGKYLFDLFPNDPADPNNLPARMLLRSFERVVETGKRDHLALIPYRVPKEVDGKQVVEERVWSATHVPLLDGDGRVRFVLQHTVDVTDVHRAAGGSSTSDGRAEVGIMSRARAVQEENAKLDAERDLLRMLHEQAPGFMAFLEGPEFVFTLCNSEYAKLVGRSEAELVGKPLREALPEVVEQGFLTLLEGVLTTGERFVGNDQRVMLQGDKTKPAEEHFVDFVYQAVRGADGKARGVLALGYDITSRKSAEREREEARRAAVAFSDELVEQSRAVQAALTKAMSRIAELEAQVAAK